MSVISSRWAGKVVLSILSSLGTIVAPTHFGFLSELLREAILRGSPSPPVFDCDEYWWTFGGFGMLLMLCWKIERNSRVVPCCERAAGPAFGGKVCFERNRDNACCWWQSDLCRPRKDCTTSAEGAETGIRSHQRFPGRGHQPLMQWQPTVGNTFLLFVFPHN